MDGGIAPFVQFLNGCVYCLICVCYVFIKTMTNDMIRISHIFPESSDRNLSLYIFGSRNYRNGEIFGLDPNIPVMEKFMDLDIVEIVL